jgi:tetratricopeptide (TPR) repeat protein
MIRIYCAFLLIVTSGAVSAQEKFLHAAQEIKSKNFKEALALYQEIPDAKKGGATWYNMGNCAYELQDYPQALLFWHRSQKYAGQNLFEQASSNIFHTQKLLGITADSGQRASHIISKMKNYFKKVPVILVQILFFCSVSVFLIFVRRLWYGKKYLLMLLCTLGIGSIAYLTLYNYVQHNSQHAVIQKESALLVGPCANYHHIVQIPCGTLVKITDDKKDWIKICWQSHQGWIPKDTVAVI